MKKQDLKDGMILETRNGKRYLLAGGVIRGFEGYIRLDNYNENLKTNHYNEFDVMKVYKESMSVSLKSIFKDEHLELIWERKEIKLTNKEIEVPKALKTLDYTYISRDEDGELYAYQNKPEKHTNTNEWWTVYISYPIKEYLFKFIKWEDEEPTKIDDLLKGV